MSFDSDLLEDEAQLLRLDDRRLLWSLAGAGAQVRHAIEVVEEYGPSRLAGNERPRAVVLVGDSPSRPALRILARLLEPAVPTVHWRGTDLPRWAGPADALLGASLDGHQPQIAALFAEAGRRGMLSSVVAPARSPVAEAAGRSPVATVDHSVHPRAALWAVLTPLLQAADALGVYSLTNAALAEVIDGLDQTAETCRPAGDLFTNPAKALAVEFAESTPVIAGAGALASIAARHCAEDLRLIAGAAALSLALPEELNSGAALLATPGSSGVDDFFRDRVDEPVGRPPRLLLIGDDGDPRDPILDLRSESQLLDELAARRAADALREVARANSIRTSTVDVPMGAALSRFAGAVAFGTFTAAYLALGLGLDPSAPGPADVDW